MLTRVQIPIQKQVPKEVVNEFCRDLGKAKGGGTLHAFPVDTFRLDSSSSSFGAFSATAFGSHSPYHSGGGIRQ